MMSLTSGQLIYQGIGQIFRGDKRKLDEVLGGQGWRYVAGALCLLPLTLTKIIDYLFRNKHLFHKAKERSIKDLKGVGLSSPEFKKYAQWLYTKGLEDYSHVSVDVPHQNETKLDSINFLKNLFNSNLKLTGTLLKTINHRISDKDLLEGATTGEVKTKYLTQKVTFGNEINKHIHTVFPLIKLGKLKGNSDTFLIFENDGLFELERKLRDLFMIPVTITVRKVKNAN